MQTPIERNLRTFLSKQKDTPSYLLRAGEFPLPKEVLTYSFVDDETMDLSKETRVVPVKSGSGKLPVIRKSDKGMVKVAELAKNNADNETPIEEITYDIQTYRGDLRVSREAIEDAEQDVIEPLAKDIQYQAINTKNAKIVDLMKTATPYEAIGLDGIKTLINTKIKRVYKPKLYLSASLFNKLDILKDEDGLYLLQPNIREETNEAFKSIRIEVLDDDMIGNAKGDLVGFIGDLHEYVVLFDRLKASLSWQEDKYNNLQLKGAVRFDTKLFDSNAGLYFNYSEI